MARLGDRLIATLLDAALLGGAFAAIGMWSATRWGGMTEGGFSINGRPFLVAAGLTLVVGLLYMWLLEGAFGATLGKAMAGVRVRMTDGARCTMGASFVRNLLRIVDGLVFYLVGFLIAAFSKLRQRLGDHLAGTVVVEKPPAAPIRALAVIAWLGAVAGGIYGAWALHEGAAQPADVNALAESGFTLRDLKFLQAEGGPERAPGPYRPGDDVYLRFGITGYARDPQNRVDVALTMVPIDPSGLALDRPADVTVRETVTGSPPISGRFHFHLPSFSPAGTYTVSVGVADAIAKRTAKFAPTLRVEGRPIATAAKLEVRDLAFRASASGPRLDPPVFTAGTPVHYSFDILGLSFRDDRASLHIAYVLVAPTGVPVIDRPDWQEVNDTFVYHPATFFLPVTGTVTLEAGAPKGKYVQRHTIEDRVSARRLVYESSFEIR